MALAILVLDDQGVATILKLGEPRDGSIADTDITQAKQMKAWKAPRRVWRLLHQLTRDGAPIPLTAHNAAPQEAKPFSVREGECLHDTANLCCFEGAARRRRVALLLRRFPTAPRPGDAGQGSLTLGGALHAGPID
jgi:hypothetical protein